eukprot:m.108651 g.108651  ORF g.108651 m.108651 type:complete len:61 (-) comp15932_c0_seq1:81-263(-)
MVATTPVTGARCQHTGGAPETVVLVLRDSSAGRRWSALCSGAVAVQQTAIRAVLHLEQGR